MGVPVGVVRAREGEKAPIDQPVQIAVLHGLKMFIFI
jgi:hypothetical protein